MGIAGVDGNGQTELIDAIAGLRKLSHGRVELAGRVFKTYASLPSYRAMLDREGAAGPAEVAIVGDHDAIGEQLLRLAEAGATEFIASPYALGEHDAGVEACLRTLVTLGAEIAARPPEVSWPG